MTSLLLGVALIQESRPRVLPSSAPLLRLLRVTVVPKGKQPRSGAEKRGRGAGWRAGQGESSEARVGADPPAAEPRGAQGAAQPTPSSLSPRQVLLRPPAGPSPPQTPPRPGASRTEGPRARPGHRPGNHRDIGPRLLLPRSGLGSRPGKSAAGRSPGGDAGRGAGHPGGPAPGLGLGAAPAPRSPRALQYRAAPHGAAQPPGAARRHGPCPSWRRRRPARGALADWPRRGRCHVGGSGASGPREVAVAVAARPCVLARSVPRPRSLVSRRWEAAAAGWRGAGWTCPRGRTRSASTRTSS